MSGTSSVVGTEEKKEVVEEVKEVEEAETASSSSSSSSSSSTYRRQSTSPQPQTISHIPEAVDDFVRNFLFKAGLRRTLKSFQEEWYSSAQKLLARTLNTEANTAGTGVFFIPDALTHKQLLLSELEAVCRETEVLREEALAAGKSLFTTQREMNFHRLQHQRVSEEKNRQIEEIRQLKTHLESFEPALKQLEEKHQVALRQKMLIGLQRDRVQSIIGVKPRREINQAEKKKSISSSERSTTCGHPNDSEFPVYSSIRVRRPSPAQARKLSTSFSLQASIRGHQQPISCIELHPQKLLLASASDDQTWKLWALPTGPQQVGELLMTGEGHSDWLTGCSFHPDGSKLATTSGDTTVRLWDLAGGVCVMTLSGHRQPTWGCSFHSTGLFLASCSDDSLVKVWDLSSQRCRQTMRRHTASVNSVCFLPSSNLLLSGSADQTINLWDTRLGLCTATLLGHRHPCNHVALSPEADVLASCDSGGMVKLWDLRHPEQPLVSMDGGPACGNQVSFSRSGKVLAVASGDGLVLMVQVDSCRVSSLAGHKNSVQSVTFDHEDVSVVSAGSDGMINIWR
ncbi:unnamed protein product [Ophioblennius macclurei]